MSFRASTATSAAAAATAAADGADSDRHSHRRRWRTWVVVALLLLAVRLTFPLIVAARLSQALGTRVDIGDLSFQPLDAIVTLRNVTVHAPSDAPPPIVAKRMRVDVQWLPLLHQQLEVRALTLESAQVDLDRRADGAFSLANLDRVEPSTALPAGWSFALDRIALHQTDVRVHDAAAGGATLVDATVRDADIAGLRRHITAFGKSKNLHVDALVGGGQLHMQGHYELRDDGLVVDASMHVKAVPLARLKAYVADLGWTDLGGQLSGRVRWQREPRRRDALSGRVVLRQGAVRVAVLAEPALAVRRVIADVSAIDLLTRRVTLASLTLRGLTLAITSNAQAPILPNLFRPSPSQRAHSEAPHWAWTIDRIALRDSRMRVLTADRHVDLQWQGSGENLGPAAYWSPVRMQLTRDAAAASFDGTARVKDGVTVEGHLTAGGIDVPSAARTIGLPHAELLQAGHATADLSVRLETIASADYPVDATGTVHLADLWLAGPDPGMFAAGCDAIDLTVNSVETHEASASLRGGDAKPRIAFADANVIAPFVLLTRTKDGWALPPFTDAETAPPDASMDISVRDVRSAGGRVMVVDLVPDPPVTWDLAHVNGSVRRVGLRGVTFDGLDLHGSDPQFGNLQLRGTRHGEINHIDVTADAVPLSALTPYLQLAGVPYRFSAGSAAFSAQTAISAGRWSADASLTLQSPDFVVIDSALERSIGMTIPSAMALLRDQNGDLTVQLTLASVATGGSYAGQIAAGVRNTIRAATETVSIAARDQATRLPVVTVLFPPGQSALSASALQELAPVAELLRNRPALIVTLDADTSVKDRRWLVEQSVQSRLDDAGGFMAVLRVFGVRDAHARVRAALAARARGAPGFLDAEDEELLARLVAEAPPPDEHAVDALRDLRIARVTSALTARSDISAKRFIVQKGDAREAGAATSSVRVEVAMPRDVEK